MKKFEEIVADIQKEYDKIKEFEAKIDKEREQQDLLCEGLTLKEKIMKRKEDEEFDNKLDNIIFSIAEYRGKIEKCRLRIKYLNNNAKIALFYEVMPSVLEVLSKYEGKRYGEKTEKKISDEIKEKTNCSMYIRYGKIHVCSVDKYGYDFDCGVKSELHDKKILDENKIQHIEMEDLSISYINRNYYEDIDSTIEELERLHKEAKQKQDELNGIFEKYNELTVDGIDTFSSIYKVR